jgi:glycosyl hydrolase family 43
LPLDIGRSGIEDQGLGIGGRVRLLVAAALLACGAVAPAAQAPAASYVFSYFINNGEDGLHFLSSQDGRKWDALNGGRSFLYPAVGSHLMRDPSIARGPDGTFHLVWTTGWWDKGIGIAHSKDLIDWSEQAFLPVMAAAPGAQNCWAPEIFFDADNARYLIFWATTTVREPDSAHRIYFVETRDFKTYTPAKILFDGGFSVIDAFIAKASPGRFVMVMKDETALPVPKKHLRVAEAPRADGPYGPASAPISVDWVEGPSVLKRGGAWTLYYDEYTRRRYGALESTDLKQWTLVKDLAFPRGVRHGTAFEVPAEVASRLAAHSTEAAGERWRETFEGIEWPAEHVAAGPSPHDDHIEMSGLRVSAIVQYGADRDPSTSLGAGGRLMLWRRVVWPMLRTIPNNTGASLQQSFGPLDLPALSVDGQTVDSERLRAVTIDGTLTIRSEALDKISLARIIFPSREQPAVLEFISVSNRSARPIRVATTAKGIGVHTDPARGVDGEYVIEATVDRPVDWSLEPGEARTYAIVYSARRASEPLAQLDGTRELENRRAFVADANRRVILDTPDPVLNKAFAFAKVRATESIFATKGGLMHGPGGGRYYAAIWANDQAEYANPFFGYLGEGNPRASALNAFRHFARFMNRDYNPIPSSIIAEGTGTWHGAKDRGDQAMIAYGASRFALASGDRAQAEELWPLIEWCLEYLKRKTTPDGVIASDSDELENRFPAGPANLNTSALTYDALVSAALLGESLGKPKPAIDDYQARAAALRTAIARHFDATIDGFDTYRYYDGNTTLRAWIATPLTVGIYDRARGTADALFSPRLWTKDGLATEAGKPDFWDRSTLYALRGVFAAGDTARAMERLTAYTHRRLLGEHVPYAVEAYPEGGQAHLSAESALYCRIFLEGMFGVRPTGLNTFTLTPRLPDGWNRMSLRAVHAFGRVFDIDVSRTGSGLRVRVTPDKGAPFDRIAAAGVTQRVVF